MASDQPESASECKHEGLECGFCGTDITAAIRALEAEVARLTSELAAAKINAGNFAVIDAGQPISDAVPTYEAMAAELAAARENEARWLWMFPDDPLISVTERIQRVYRKWDGSDSWNDAVDAARRAGEGKNS